MEEKEQSPNQIAHEVLNEMGFPPRELHHYRGRGKLPEPFDHILLLSTIPVSTQQHTTSHLIDKRKPFNELNAETIFLLTVAMDRQIERMIARNMFTKEVGNVGS